MKKYKMKNLVSYMVRIFLEGLIYEFLKFVIGIYNSLINRDSAHRPVGGVFIFDIKLYHVT